MGVRRQRYRGGARTGHVCTRALNARPNLPCHRYHRIGVPTYGLYLRASERGRFLDLLRAYPQQDIRVGGQAVL